MDARQRHWPPEWDDDKKMSVLFAPFREKSLNPQSWEKKMKFWTQLIIDDFKHSGEFVVNMKSLPTRFFREGRKPGCLDAVIQEMWRINKLRKSTDYQWSGTGGWMSWGLETFVKRPVTWGLGFVMKSSEANDGLFVIHEIVQEKAEELLEAHYSSVDHEATDNIVELSTLKERHQSVCKTDMEFDIILQQLQKDKKVVVSQTKEHDVIVKFCKKSERQAMPIQDLELNVLRIQKVEKHLEKQIEALTIQCDSHTADARKHIREGKKSLALQCLKRRKTVQKTLNRKTSSVNILQNIIHKIQDSASNEMVVKAYESGISTLKALTNDTPLDKVESVLDNLQEVLEDQEEITQAMSRADLTGIDASQEELEIELDNLLAEDRETMEENIDDLSDVLSGLDFGDLPSVPKFSPSQEKASTKGGITPERTRSKIPNFAS